MNSNYIQAGILVSMLMISLGGWGNEHFEEYAELPLAYIGETFRVGDIFSLAAAIGAPLGAWCVGLAHKSKPKVEQ